MTAHYLMEFSNELFMWRSRFLPRNDLYILFAPIFEGNDDFGVALDFHAAHLDIQWVFEHIIHTECDRS